MELDYMCPHCKGFLSLEDCVLFSVKTSDRRLGLLSLHPELGNYTVRKHRDFDFEEGEELDFYCPICHAELASKLHSNLAKIVMVDENYNEFDILFSKKAGERSTYKIEGETMEIFGDDSAEYIDFMNLSTIF